MHSNDTLTTNNTYQRVQSQAEALKNAIPTEWDKPMEFFLFRMGAIYKFFNTQFKSEKVRQLIKVEWYQSLVRANIHPTEIFDLVEAIKYTYDDYPNPSRGFIEWARSQGENYKHAVNKNQSVNAIPELIGKEITPEHRQANIEKARSSMRRGERKHDRAVIRASRFSEEEKQAMQAAQLELEQRKIKG